MGKPAYRVSYNKWQLAYKVTYNNEQPCTDYTCECLSSFTLSDPVFHYLGGNLLKNSHFEIETLLVFIRIVRMLSKYKYYNEKCYRWNKRMFLIQETRHKWLGFTGVAGKTTCPELICHYLPHPLPGATWTLKTSSDGLAISYYLREFFFMEVPGSFINFRTELTSNFENIYNSRR